MSDQQNVSNVSALRTWPVSATGPGNVDNPLAELGLAVAAQQVAAARTAEVVGRHVASGALTWQQVGDLTGVGRKVARSVYGRALLDAVWWRSLERLPEPKSLGDVMANLRAAGALA